MNAITPLLAVRVASAADRARIRAFVLSRPEAEPFHLPEWGEAVERGCGQRAHVLLAEGPGGAIAGVLPLSEVRSPLFGAALVSTGFGVGGGVLGDGVEALAEAAWAHALAAGCASVELRGGILPQGWQRRTGTYAGFVRDLPRDEGDAVLKSIPRKQRAEVRRALGFGLEVAIGRDLDRHYRAYSESVRNLGTPVFPRALFAAVLDGFGADADIVTVHRGGEVLASVLSLYLGGTVYPYWGGGTAAARGARANELMYYALMRHAARRGCTRFDFGRSKLGTGAFAFKKNWGFEPRPLTYAVRGEAREVNPLSPRYRLQVAAWKKLPLWLANRLGPPIARGLG
jgi:FemAB-related protein (PEP-CTERM system-associated)